MKDLHNNIKVSSVLHPIGIAATATYTDIDLADFNSAEIVIDIGADAALDANNKWVFTLKDSADGITYANVETDDMLGVTVVSGIILTVDSTDEDNTVYQFGYVGGQRYLELTCTETGTLTGPMAITIIKSHGLDVPAIS